MLDGTHRLDSSGSVLRLKKTLLALTYAVLTSASSFHGERPLREAIEKGSRAIDFHRVFHHHRDARMEVAVTSVTDDRRN